MGIFKRYLVKVMQQHLNEALEGPSDRLKALDDRVGEVEAEWSVVADELDRVSKNVHRELGHINRAKRGKKEPDEDDSTRESRQPSTPRRYAFGSPALSQTGKNGRHFTASPEV